MKIGIYGSNIATLFFARQSLRNNCEVTLFKSKTFTGHFGGINNTGHQIDAGMLLIEPPRSEVRYSLESYNGEERSESVPFHFAAIDWFNEYLDLESVEIQALFRGKLVADYFIRDSLEVLSHLDETEKSKIKVEAISATSLLSSSGHHPSKKLTEPWFEKVSFKQAVASSIGETFYETLFRPWLQKMYGSDSEELVAKEHRIGWMPLYYPETVLDALNSQIVLQEHQFLYPARSSFAEFITRLEADVISKSNLVEVSDFSEGTKYSQDHGIDRNFYFGKTEMFGLIKPNIYFQTKFIKGKQVVLKTQSPLLKTIFIADSEIEATRINVRGTSNNTPGYISIEFGYSARHHTDSELLKAAYFALESCELLEIADTPHGINDLFFPLRVTGTKDDFEISENLNITNWDFIQVGDMNSSLNDQTVTALAAAHTLFN